MSNPLRLGEEKPRRWESWRKPKPQPLPVRSSVLGIYAMPHGSGLVWALVVFVILGWSLNTSNNMGLMLGSLLGVAGVYGALMPAGLLFGLRLVSAHAEPVHEGSPVVLRLRFRSYRNPDGIVIESGSNFEPVVFDGQGAGEAGLSVMALRRGVYAWPFLKASTRRPFGISVSWMRLWPEGEVVVWPQPETSGPGCPGGVGMVNSEQVPSRGQSSQQAEEWSGLREYRPGDRRRDIDWKRVARTGSYWVRQYDAPPGGEVEIRWNDTEGMGHEARIRRLARWVMEAERQGRSSALVLPGETVPLGRGLSHRAACLTALSRMPHE